MRDRPRGPEGRWWNRALGGDLGSYRRQVVAATALLGSVAAVVLIVVVHLAFSESAVDAADRVLQIRADDVVRSAEADSSSTVLEVPTSQLGPGVAVYDSRGQLVAGEVAPALADEAGQLGTVDRVTIPERLDAHKLIEEFMIQANVAAAETLEGRRSPLVYRVHDQPSLAKLEALK